MLQDVTALFLFFDLQVLHFSACKLISEGRLSYPPFGDMTFVCRVTDKFRVMIDLLRDGSACPVFCSLKGDSLTQKLFCFKEIDRK